MKKRYLAITLIPLMITLLADRAWSNELEAGKWSHMATIEVESPSDSRLAECVLTPEVYEVARPGLADLRVATKEGEETAYLLRTSRGKSHRLPLRVSLYNRSFIPDDQSSVTVDFGKNVLKNQVKVTTPGTDFRRRVRIEASDDAKSWQTVVDGAFLFRIRAPSGKGKDYDKSLVRFPDNDQRYLRITVYNGPDDAGVVDIQNVQAWKRFHTLPETMEVPVASFSSKEKGSKTRIVLDLGTGSMPLHALSLAFSDKNFFRRAKVSGRNSEFRKIRRRVEDSPALERKIKVPWKRIARGTLYRFSEGEGEEASLRLKLSGAPSYRYLLVEIENRNDAPLHLTGATAFRLVQRIVFPKDNKDTYALYVGNPKASAPKYDIGHYVGKLSRKGLDRAELGELIPNPLHKEHKKAIPWSERHKWIIWLVLLMMAAILGLLVYRVATSAGKAAKS
jgi:uncharacterized protein DUF3999